MYQAPTLYATFPVDDIKFRVHWDNCTAHESWRRVVCFWGPVVRTGPGRIPNLHGSVEVPVKQLGCTKSVGCGVQDAYILGNYINSLMSSWELSNLIIDIHDLSNGEMTNWLPSSGTFRTGGWSTCHWCTIKALKWQLTSAGSLSEVAVSSSSTFHEWTLTLTQVWKKDVASMWCQEQLCLEYAGGKPIDKRKKNRACVLHWTWVII